MTRVELAKQLGIPRTSLNNHIKNGCPTSSVDTAAAWIQNHKREPLGATSHYEVSEVDGNDSEARFSRLVASEEYVSGQIRTLQERVLPDLVSQLTDEPDNKAIQAKLSKASQDLIAQRKSWLLLSKTIADLEFKKASVAGDTVPVSFVQDVITRVFMGGIMAYANAHPDATLAYLLQDSVNRILNDLSDDAPIGYNE